MKSLTIDQLKDGMQKILQNARSLIDDARVLYNAGRPTRAFTLAHLAREELSKTIMMFRIGIELLLEHPADWKQFGKRFRDHGKKLQLDALQMFQHVPDGTGFADEDLFRMMIADVAYRNDKKNNSLYVSFIDDSFVLPADVVDDRSAWCTMELAELSYEFCTMSIDNLNSASKMPREALKERFGSIMQPLSEKPHLAPAMLREYGRQLKTLVFGQKQGAAATAEITPIPVETDPVAQPSILQRVPQ